MQHNDALPPAWLLHSWSAVAVCASCCIRCTTQVHSLLDSAAGHGPRPCPYTCQQRRTSAAACAAPAHTGRSSAATAPPVSWATVPPQTALLPGALPPSGLPSCKQSSLLARGQLATACRTPAPRLLLPQRQHGATACQTQAPRLLLPCCGTAAPAGADKRALQHVLSCCLLQGVHVLVHLEQALVSAPGEGLPGADAHVGVGRDLALKLVLQRHSSRKECSGRWM